MFSRVPPVLLSMTATALIGGLLGPLPASAQGDCENLDTAQGQFVMSQLRSKNSLSEGRTWGLTCNNSLDSRLFEGGWETMPRPELAIDQAQESVRIFGWYLHASYVVPALVEKQAGWTESFPLEVRLIVRGDINPIKNAVEAAGIDPSKIRVSIGTFGNPYDSTLPATHAGWSHTKMIVVDGAYISTGGHNFMPKWTGSPPGYADFSMGFAGDVAVEATNFFEAAWNDLVCDYISSDAWTNDPNLGVCIPRDSNFYYDVGGAKLLSLGQLGFLGGPGNCAGEHALTAMIDAAEDTLVLVQDVIVSRQTTHNPVIELTGIGTSFIARPYWPDVFLEAVARALLRGVDVTIVGSRPEYGYNQVIRAFGILYDGELPDGYTNPALLLHDRLHVGDMNANSLGDDQHAKVALTDDVLAYVGSQNYYQQGMCDGGYRGSLAEHGVIFEDAGMIAEVKSWIDQVAAHTPLLDTPDEAEENPSDLLVATIPVNQAVPVYTSYATHKSYRYEIEGFAIGTGNNDSSYKWKFPNADGWYQFGGTSLASVHGSEFARTAWGDADPLEDPMPYQAESRWGPSRIEATLKIWERPGHNEGGYDLVDPLGIEQRLLEKAAGLRGSIFGRGQYFAAEHVPGELFHYEGEVTGAPTNSTFRLGYALAQAEADWGENPGWAIGSDGAGITHFQLIDPDSRMDNEGDFRPTFVGAIRAWNYIPDFDLNLWRTGYHEPAGEATAQEPMDLVPGLVTVEEGNAATTPTEANKSAYSSTKSMDGFEAAEIVDTTAFGSEWSHRSYLKMHAQDPAVPGASVDLVFQVRARDRVDDLVDLALEITRGPEFGDIQVDLDGGLLGTFRGWADDIEHSGPLALGRHALDDGEHTLTVTVLPTADDAGDLGLDTLWIGRKDTDGDGVFDAEDNCGAVENADQADSDGDSEGDACEASPGPVAYFPFETCTGGFYTGEGAQGGVGCAGGAVGSAASFDGSDDRVELANQPAYNFTDALTVAAWIKPDDIWGPHAVINKWNAMDSYLLSVVDGRIDFFVSFPNGAWGESKGVSGVVVEGQWTHVAGTYDGSAVRLYVNGRLVDETPASGTLQQSGRPLTIGHHLGAYEGEIDEIYLFNYALGGDALLELAGFNPAQLGRVTDFQCSTEWEAGWCEHVMDDIHGSCNWGEWATQSQTTGWVELSLDEATEVVSVGLWDRACGEQVTAGHLEFSDGSTVPFGPLENGGNTSTRLTFNPRTTTYVRVVIDQSAHGSNPGIGEIVINDRLVID